MPTYDYFCDQCGKTHEQFFKIDDRKQFVVCPHCGCSAERIVSAKIQRDEPTWLDSAVSNLLSDGKDVKPITDRGAYKKYLRDNNIVEAG